MDFDKPSRAISFRKPTSILKKLSKLLLVFVLTASFTYGSLSAVKHASVSNAVSENISAAIDGIPALTAEALNLDNKRVVRLMEPVSMDVAQEIQQKLLDLNAEDEKTPIVLLIESPGGDVMAGAKILDAIKMSKAPVHAQIIGICASMAAIIAVHCNKIYVTQGAWLLFHNASLSVPNTDIRMVKEWLEFHIKRMEEINRSTAEKLNLSYEEYLKKINMVYLITADEAVRTGVADGYVTEILCKKGVDGCKEKLYKPKQDSFFGF